MIGKRFESIDLSDLDLLVANGVRESKTIEYKQKLPSRRDSEKKEFLADVSSFANASGGDLLYGITERRDESGKPTGIPEAVDGLDGINPDQEIQRLDSMLRDGIEPRIPGVQLQAIDGCLSGSAIHIRVPNSWASPHMVTFQASPRFFSRTSNGKAPLDVGEIRAAFLQSDALPEKVRRFREDRLGKILAGETPHRLRPGPSIVLHMVPIASIANPPTVDPVTFTHQRAHLLGNGRLNLDGFVTIAGDDLTNGAYGYTQVFRNGIIEHVDSFTLTGLNGDTDFIPSLAFENEVTCEVRKFLKVFASLQIGPPIVLMLSMLGVKDYYMYTSGAMPRQHLTIDRDHLLIPDIVVEEVDDEVDVILHPIFDLVWQACGFQRSLSYGEDGRWKG